MEQATTGKRERNKADKQRRIVDAATELFQANGFEETTTAEIASRAGVGAGTLYLYVDSKEDLLAGAFLKLAGTAWEAGFDTVDPSDPLIDQIMGVFEHVTRYHDGDRRMARLFFKELPFVGPSARKAVDGFTDWFEGRLEGLLASAAESGGLDSSVPHRALAQVLYAHWQLQMRTLVAGTIEFDKMMADLKDGVAVTLWAMTPET